MLANSGLSDTQKGLGKLDSERSVMREEIKALEEIEEGKEWRK